jgi:effector-binding domain-containing protein
LTFIRSNLKECSSDSQKKWERPGATQGNEYLRQLATKVISESIGLKDIPERTVAYLKCRGAWRQLRGRLELLQQQMADIGLKSDGPPSGIYYNNTAKAGVRDLEWEVLIPVTTRLVPHDTDGSEFGVRTAPGARVAFIYHRGPYRSAGSTYRVLEDWILERGMSVNGPNEEVYLTEFTVPESQMLMEIRIPVTQS